MREREQFGRATAKMQQYLGNCTENVLFWANIFAINHEMSKTLDIGILGSDSDLDKLRGLLPRDLGNVKRAIELESIPQPGNEQEITCWIYLHSGQALPAGFGIFSKRLPFIAVLPAALKDSQETSLLESGFLEVTALEGLDSAALQSLIRSAVARFQSYEGMRSRERMFQNLCDTLPFQMSYRIEVKPDVPAKFVYVSEGIRHISGLSREDVLENPHVLYEQIIPQDRPKLKEAEDEAVRTLTPFEIEVRKKSTFGTIRWVHIRSFPQKKSDGSIIWDGVESDITTYKNAEEAVKELLSKNEFLLASERQAREESEHNSRMKDEFLATLSHELRTPINAVLGWAQLMKRGMLSSEEVKKAIDIVERNASAQAKLIADLLDMSRIIAGNINLSLEKVDVELAIKSAVDSITPTAEAKEIRLSVSIDAGMSDMLYADAARLQQIISNLLSNAVKFTPKKGEVLIGVADVGRYIEFSVKDSGIGIKNDFLPQVFERFRQADSSFSRTFGGLGLGLAIVRHLAVLHGGTVKATSEGEGMGSTFTVCIPKALAVSGAERVPFSLIDERPTETFSFRNAKILIVDDEPDSLDLLNRLLVQSGAEVSAASSAEKAIKLLNEKHKTFDLLVSDIGMPSKDGFQLIAELRNSFSKSRNIPAIALTAFARQEDKKRAIEAGYQKHISKPLDARELFLAISDIFTPSASAAVNS